jgi:glyoxylase-like metal-dependent hydrolase (beta-lactamase superfamily II)/8-oxo-dGTP pyrophosphatase MutT (NUDIX family)
MASMPRPATSVVPFRFAPDLEVFLLERSPDLEVFGGYHAFPGGSVQPGDEAVPVEGGDSLPVDGRAALGCAVRELLEETGLLALLGLQVSAGELRSRLLGGEDAASFFRGLASRGLRLDSGTLRPLLRLVTPRFARRRFDTRFFLYECSRGDTAAVAGGEAVAGTWWRPGAALGAWKRGEIYLAPPSRHILEHLDRAPLREAEEALRSTPAEFEGSGGGILWIPGVEVVPLHTPPLPESIPTNAFLLGGRRFVILDPGPSAEEGREHLFGAIDRRIEAGHQAEAVVLTHHHPDHVGALDAVLDRCKLPLWAHPLTGELLSRRLDRELEDGDEIELGEGTDGSGAARLRALFTPGHAEGHLAFHDERQGALIAGDLVSTIVSMYVGSPGGHLATYFRSLERVRGLGLRILFPAHGPPTLKVRELIDQTLAHRRERLKEAVALLGAEPIRVEDLAARIYHSADPRLRVLFERVTRAALEHLSEEGKARRRGEDLYSRA